MLQGIKHIFGHVVVVFACAIKRVFVHRLNIVSADIKVRFTKC